MLISAEGIVTKSITMRENDSLIAILTKDYGLIHAFINNSRQLKSKLLAATELGSHCIFTLYVKGEKYTVREAQVLNQFSNMRADITRLSLCCYILQAAGKLASEGEFSESYLRLVLCSLYVLNKKQKDPLLIKGIFDLKAASISGYMPSLVCCSCCSDQDINKPYRFLISGEIICEECFKIEGGASAKSFKISSGVLLAMRHIIYSDISKIFSFVLSDETDIASLSKLASEYFMYKTDLHLPSSTFFSHIISLN